MISGGSELAHEVMPRVDKSPPCSNGGCRGLSRAASSTNISTTTSTNSPSASIGVDHRPEASCSTASSSRRWPSDRPPTTPSSHPGYPPISPNWGNERDTNFRSFCPPPGAQSTTGSYSMPIRVRSDVIVVVMPGGEEPAGMRYSVKHLLVQQLVSQPADQTLDEGILLRFAGCDVVLSHVALVGPAQHRLRGHFRTVIADDQPRPATPGDQDIELARQPLPGDRGVGNRGQAFAGEAIHDHQDAEPAPLVETVRGEIQGPPIVARLGHRHRLSGARGVLAASPPAHRQALLAVEPVWATVAVPPIRVDTLVQLPAQDRRLRVRPQERGDRTLARPQPSLSTLWNMHQLKVDAISSTQELISLPGSQTVVGVATRNDKPSDARIHGPFGCTIRETGARR